MQVKYSQLAVGTWPSVVMIPHIIALEVHMMSDECIHACVLQRRWM